MGWYTCSWWTWGNYFLKDYFIVNCCMMTKLQICNGMMLDNISSLWNKKVWKCGALVKDLFFECRFLGSKSNLSHQEKCRWKIKFNSRSNFKQMIFEPLNYTLSFDNYIWYQVIGIHKMLIKISIYPTWIAGFKYIYIYLYMCWKFQKILFLKKWRIVWNT
jgi:hypothetical protein